MFDFAVVYCSVLFHFGFERSVATVQLHRTAALSGQLYSEGECFHVVIIADWELLVNPGLCITLLDQWSMRLHLPSSVADYVLEQPRSKTTKCLWQIPVCSKGTCLDPWRWNCGPTQWPLLRSTVKYCLFVCLSCSYYSILVNFGQEKPCTGQGHKR